MSPKLAPKRSQGTPEPQEETPLLCDGNAPRMKTPLPIKQIAVLLLLHLSDPITSQSIKPYINQVRFNHHYVSHRQRPPQLVSELPVVGGDERKVGYYAGLIVCFVCSPLFRSVPTVFVDVLVFCCSGSYCAPVEPSF